MKTKCKLLVGGIEIYLPTRKRASKFYYFSKKISGATGPFHFVTKGFLKFFTMKEATHYKNYINGFSEKKFLFGAIRPFLSRKSYIMHQI